MAIISLELAAESATQQMMWVEHVRMHLHERKLQSPRSRPGSAGKRYSESSDASSAPATPRTADTVSHASEADDHATAN